MTIETTAPFDNGSGEFITRRVLFDVLSRQVIAAEVTETSARVFDGDGGAWVIDMSLGAFREAYEAAKQNEDMGL